ncbi:MAG: sigma-54 dependent transcriptional regulator [Pseudomonadota bacterium]
MTRPIALVVDDEPDICELLEITLLRMGVDAHSEFSLKSAHKLLQKRSFDLCFTDMRLPDGNGIDLVRYINKKHPDLPVAMITAHGNMETAIAALKAGAFDFVSKPVDLTILRNLVDKAIKLRSQSTQPRTESRPKQDPSQELLLGDSEVMHKVRNLIAKLARSQAPVYVSGESGTGKELAARSIHSQGPRSENEFVAVNCGAIPAELMESELFGHLKGSFTGAITNKQGLFQLADGGTLFLDEVADLPLHMQVKLLRAIQEKRIRPIGGEKEMTVDVRIICATHENLAQLVEQGDFRQDLYYRLNVIELPIPPLRERPNDIPLLAQHILTRISQESEIAKPNLKSGALKKLQHYAFPGNVRELENILERAVTLCDGGSLEVEDISLPKASREASSSLQNNEIPLGDKMEEVERQAITQALEETRWNRTAAAKRLGMSLRSLRYRLEKLGIE